MAVEKKGITVKIDAELHAEVRQFSDSHEMTMAEFVTLAFQNELQPKLNIKEEKTMGNIRTLAFQVPEELFQKIKDYLQRNNMTQKEFVIGLIENEIERDLTQRAGQSEQPETTAVSDFEDVSNGESEDEESEDEDLSDDEGEFEGQGMAMEVQVNGFAAVQVVWAGTAAKHSFVESQKICLKN